MNLIADDFVTCDLLLALHWFLDHEYDSVSSSTKPGISTTEYNIKTELISSFNFWTRSKNLLTKKVLLEW